MTDTDQKEVEKIVYSSNNVIRDIIKWIEEDRKRNQDNALVPLEWKAMLTELLNAKADDYTEFGEVDFKKLCKFLCAKFGKDNSGMVPRAGLLTEDKADQVARDIYDLIHLTVKPPSGKEFGAYIECRGIAKALIDKYGFSQQPPKERKVSLEEIRQTIRKHGGWESSIDDISKAILSLLNAKESTEKES